MDFIYNRYIYIYIYIGKFYCYPSVEPCNAYTYGFNKWGPNFGSTYLLQPPNQLWESQRGRHSSEKCRDIVELQNQNIYEPTCVLAVMAISKCFYITNHVQHADRNSIRYTYSTHRSCESPGIFDLNDSFKMRLMHIQLHLRLLKEIVHMICWKEYLPRLYENRFSIVWYRLHFYLGSPPQAANPASVAIVCILFRLEAKLPSFLLDHDLTAHWGCEDLAVAVGKIVWHMNRIWSGNWRNVRDLRVHTMLIISNILWSNYSVVVDDIIYACVIDSACMSMT